MTQPREKRLCIYSEREFASQFSSFDHFELILANLTKIGIRSKHKV